MVLSLGWMLRSWGRDKGRGYEVPDIECLAEAMELNWVRAKPSSYAYPYPCIRPKPTAGRP